MKKLFCWSLSLLLLGVALNARAESFEIAFENDLFADTDQSYTHGSLLTLYQDGLPSCMKWTADSDVLDFLLAGKPDSMSHSIGQWIYTPEDKESVPPPADDRPYAGVLFYEGTLYSQKHKDEDDSDSMTALGLQLGLVGPHSYAEQAQKEVHKLTNDPFPKGWDYQLDDEPILNLVWQKYNRLLDYNWFDFTSHYGGAFGNANIYANGGATARLGFNLPDGFNRVSFEPMPRGLSGMDSVFLQATVDGRIVGRNITLDGNTFDDQSPSVDKETFVADMGYGLGVRIFELNFSFMYFHRTGEYEGEDSHDYGRVSMMFDW